MDDWRGIGEVGARLMQRISSGDFPLWGDELGGDLGGNPGADARPGEGDEFEMFGGAGEAAPEAGGPDWRQRMRGVNPGPSAALTPMDGASGPETAPARRQARESLGLKLVVDNCGRAGMTHAATGRPALPARLHLVAMSESEHHAFSGTR